MEIMFEYFGLNCFKILLLQEFSDIFYVFTWRGAIIGSPLREICPNITAWFVDTDV